MDAIKDIKRLELNDGDIVVFTCSETPYPSAMEKIADIVRDVNKGKRIGIVFTDESCSAKVYSPSKTIAQEAYEAYSESTGNKNFQGNEMPTWAELPEKIKTAWAVAAQAVASIAQNDLIKAYQEGN
jgi:hypothetical protein